MRIEAGGKVTDVTVHGVGGEAPIQITPAEIDFGTVPVAEPIVRTVTIEDVGEGTRSRSSKCESTASTTLRSPPTPRARCPRPCAACRSRWTSPSRRRMRAVGSRAGDRPTRWRAPRAAHREDRLRRLLRSRRRAQGSALRHRGGGRRDRAQLRAPQQCVGRVFGGTVHVRGIAVVPAEGPRSHAALPRGRSWHAAARRALHAGAQQPRRRVGAPAHRPGQPDGEGVRSRHDRRRRPHRSARHAARCRVPLGAPRLRPADPGRAVERRAAPLRIASQELTTDAPGLSILALAPVDLPVDGRSTTYLRLRTSSAERFQTEMEIWPDQAVEPVVVAVTGTGATDTCRNCVAPVVSCPVDRPAWTHRESAIQAAALLPGGGAPTCTWKVTSAPAGSSQLPRAPPIARRASVPTSTAPTSSSSPPPTSPRARPPAART